MFNTVTKTLCMSFECFFLSIQPNFYHTYHSGIKQCIRLKDNDKSEFNFVLVELCSNRSGCFPFHCNLDAFTVTKKFVSRHLSIAAARTIQFLHRRFQSSIPDLVVPEGNKRQKRKTWCQRVRYIISLPSLR